MSVGESCKFSDLDAGTFETELYLIKIGDHVDITSGFRFIIHEGSAWVFKHDQPDVDILKPIKIGNNVFISMRSLILPRVSIEDNVVIGAVSIIVSDIPSDPVAVVARAKVIRELDGYYNEAKQWFCSKKKMIEA